MIKAKPFGRPSLADLRDDEDTPGSARGHRDAVLAQLADDMAAAPGAAPGTRMGAFALNGGLLRSHALGPGAASRSAEAALEMGLVGEGARHPWGGASERSDDDDDRPTRAARPVRAAAPAARAMPAWQRHFYLALGLCLALTGWTYVRDATTVSQAITEGLTQRTVLVCMDGRMYYPDPSLWARLSGQGFFSCTDWRQVRGFGDLTLP